MSRVDNEHEVGPDQLARDDAARDVAQSWIYGSGPLDAMTVRENWPGLAAALDRLAVAYGITISR